MNLHRKIWVQILVCLIIGGMIAETLAILFEWRTSSLLFGAAVFIIWQGTIYIQKYRARYFSDEDDLTVDIPDNELLSDFDERNKTN